MRIRIPGNLLIAGEYAITETGGLGLAIGIDRHVEVTFAEQNQFEIIGRYSESEVRIDVDCNGDSLPARVCRFICSSLGIDINHLDGGWIVDSSALYRNGKKLGYGSSAASTIAICAAILHSVKMSEDEIRDRLPSIAVESHRMLQNGRASGYDVLASFYGGIGLFTGGATPTWRSIAVPWFEDFKVMNASSSVRTRGAINSYDRWKSLNPRDASEYLENSNQAVLGLAESKTESEAKHYLERTRMIGIKLGETIGVSAEMSVDPAAAAVANGAANGVASAAASPAPGASTNASEMSSLSGCIYKALGAGNEVIGSFFGDDYCGDGFEPERIDRDGTVWQ